jgi:hypothetical protein
MLSNQPSANQGINEVKDRCRQIFKVAYVALEIEVSQFAEEHFSELKQACFKISVENQEYDGEFKSASLAVQEAFGNLTAEEKDQLKETQAYKPLIFAFAAITEIARAENWQ